MNSIVNNNSLIPQNENNNSISCEPIKIFNNKFMLSQGKLLPDVNEMNRLNRNTIFQVAKPKNFISSYKMNNK